MKQLAIILIIAVMGLAGCASQRTVTRIDTQSPVDLSGRWNDTDSRLVAEEMLRDGLSRPWLHRFVQQKQKDPVVVVGLVRNRTHEHISTEIFIKDIEREFLNSGKVRLVQAGEAREELRNERADQQEYASPETIKRWGKELGADYILQGVVNSVADEYNKKQVVLYQVDLELTDLETSEKVWIGNKKIRKFIEN